MFGASALSRCLGCLTTLVLICGCTGNGHGTQGVDAESEADLALDINCPSGLDCAPEDSSSDGWEQCGLQDGLQAPTEPRTLAWVNIPGGTFLMGCSTGDSDCDDDERPSHEVTVDAFEMLETEVTLSQFELVLGWSPGGQRPSCDEVDRPVVNFTSSDAEVFCQSLGGRFPSEAEWEWAARGGEATRFFCGDSAECLQEVAWYEANSDGVLHSVGLKLPNAYGLYDMHGNAREWTADWYDPEYYTNSPSHDPQGPEQGMEKVVRGGGYLDPGQLVRVSRRDSEEESDDYGWPDVGFRCVR